MLNFIYLLALVILTSCVQKPVAPVVETPEEKPIDVSKALSWETKAPERADWSKRLMYRLAEDVDVFSVAQMEDFCPGYLKKDKDSRIYILAEMFVKISKFESNWNPKAKFQEPQPPAGPGTVSRGLFQMSYGDGNGCPKSVSAGDLHDPLVNIDCAVKKAVALVKRDGKIAVGVSGSTARGLCRYWSVTREHKHLGAIKAHVRGVCK